MIRSELMISAIRITSGSTLDDIEETSVVKNWVDQQINGVYAISSIRYQIILDLRGNSTSCTMWQLNKLYDTILSLDTDVAAVMNR